MISSAAADPRRAADRGAGATPVAAMASMIARVPMWPAFLAICGKTVSSPKGPCPNIGPRPGGNLSPFNFGELNLRQSMIYRLNSGEARNLTNFDTRYGNYAVAVYPDSYSGYGPHLPTPSKYSCIALEPAK